MGSDFAVAMARRAQACGFKATEEPLQNPLSICGVGNGSQQCTFDCALPVALKTTRGERRIGTMCTPTVTKSPLPGLLGLNALKKNRAILDFNTNKLCFLGPGDYDLGQAMPAGTDAMKCVNSPSGHLILPCCEYDAKTPTRPLDALTLHISTKTPPTKKLRATTTKTVTIHAPDNAATERCGKSQTDLPFHKAASSK